MCDVHFSFLYCSLCLLRGVEFGFLAWSEFRMIMIILHDGMSVKTMYDLRLYVYE